MRKDEKEAMELEAKLRLAIKKELEKCKASVTPKFCEMIKTKQGYLKAESMIIDYSIKNQISVSAAIGQIEAELE